jgi:hypothetical protein
MANTVAEPKANRKADEWRERIAEQACSGLSVKQFCGERGLAECSFYAWRKRLRQNGPVRFALVERETPLPNSASNAPLELVLTKGERLRIGSGVDGATLRTVLEALRR